MTEYWIGWDGTLKLLIAVFVSMFYWLGGRHNNWLRRYIAPLFMIAYCYFFAGSVVVFSYALYAGAYTVGYGPNSRLTKMLPNNPYLVRAICGFLYGFAGLGIMLGANNNYAGWVFLTQIVLAVFCTVLFSKVLKMVVAHEENAICFVSCVLVPWYGKLLIGG